MVLSVISLRITGQFGDIPAPELVDPVWAVESVPGRQYPHYFGGLVPPRDQTSEEV